MLDHLVKACRVPRTVSVNCSFEGVDEDSARLSPDLVGHGKRDNKVVPEYLCHARIGSETILESHTRILLLIIAWLRFFMYIISIISAGASKFGHSTFAGTVLQKPS